MNMSPTMKLTYERLQLFGEYVIAKEIPYTPANFVPSALADKVKYVRGECTVDGSSWYLVSINRQSINNLIRAGYAEYTDATRERVRLIDKEKLTPAAGPWQSEEPMDDGLYLLKTETHTGQVIYMGGKRYNESYWQCSEQAWGIVHVSNIIAWARLIEPQEVK